jgi:hypothetical protein
MVAGDLESLKPYFCYITDDIQNHLIMIRLNSSEEIYTNQPWYKDLKSRWSNYFDDLEKHWLKMFFR